MARVVGTSHELPTLADELLLLSELQLEPNAWSLRSLPKQRECATVADLAVSVSRYLQLVRRTLELSCEAPKLTWLRQLQLLVGRPRASRLEDPTEPSGDFGRHARAYYTKPQPDHANTFEVQAPYSQFL